jgi:hypothetical protein
MLVCAGGQFQVPFMLRVGGAYGRFYLLTIDGAGIDKSRLGSMDAGDFAMDSAYKWASMTG